MAHRPTAATANRIATPPTFQAPGNIWDAARRKGLTYRSYGEYASRVSDGTTMEASPNAQGLAGHVAPGYKRMAVRDTENAAEFIREFDQYEKNYDSKDPEKRLPELHGDGAV